MASTITKEVVCEVHPRDHFDELKITIYPTYGKSYQKNMTPLGPLIYGCLVEFDQTLDGEVYYKIESFKNQRKIKSYSPTYTQYSSRRGLQHINYQQHPFQLIRLSPLYKDGEKYVIFIHSRVKGEGEFLLTSKEVPQASAKLVMGHPTQNIYRLEYNEQVLLRGPTLNLTFKNKKQSTHIDTKCSFIGNGNALDVKRLPPCVVESKKKFYLQLSEFQQASLLSSKDLTVFDGIILPPPFLSHSHHGYDALNYHLPHKDLENWETYAKMVAGIKASGMIVIQDFNINHGHKDNDLSKKNDFTHSPIRYWSEDENLIEYDFSKKNVLDFFHRLTEKFRREYHIDKFRIDCGNELPISFYRNSPKDYIYETWHYPSKALNEIGVQNLNYTFLWGFLSHLTDSPVVFYRLLCETLAGHFNTNMSLNLNYLSSHDTELFIANFGEDVFFKGLALLAFLPGDCILFCPEVLKIESKENFAKLISSVRDFCLKGELPEIELIEGKDLSLKSGKLSCFISLTKSEFSRPYEESFSKVLIKRKGLIIGKE